MRHKPEENAFLHSGRRDGVPTAVSSNGSKSKISRLLYYKKWLDTTIFLPKANFFVGKMSEMPNTAGSEGWTPGQIFDTIKQKNRKRKRGIKLRWKKSRVLL
jgi:hypothetical protein